jgi:hypothetical protein
MVQRTLGWLGNETSPDQPPLFWEPLNTPVREPPKKRTPFVFRQERQERVCCAAYPKPVRRVNQHLYGLRSIVITRDQIPWPVAERLQGEGRFG